MKEGERKKKKARKRELSPVVGGKSNLDLSKGTASQHNFPRKVDLLDKEASFFLSVFLLA